MPSLATLRLIGYGVGALAVIALLAMVNTWRVGYRDRGEKLAVICQATREAAADPKMHCGNVVVQIHELGTSLKSTTDALNRQNAAVNAWAAKDAADKAVAAKASRIAQERAGRAQATSSRLDASSRAGERLAKPCEPSAELRRNWQ